MVRKESTVLTKTSSLQLLFIPRATISLYEKKFLGFKSENSLTFRTFFRDHNSTYENFLRICLKRAKKIYTLLKLLDCNQK